MVAKETAAILKHMREGIVKGLGTPAERLEQMKNAPDYAERLKAVYEEALSEAISALEKSAETNLSRGSDVEA